MFPFYSSYFLRNNLSVLRYFITIFFVTIILGVLKGNISDKKFASFRGLLWPFDSENQIPLKVFNKHKRRHLVSYRRQQILEEANLAKIISKKQTDKPFLNNDI